MKRILNLLLLVFITTSAFAQNWSKNLEKSAKKGHVASQLQLGDVYYNGLGVDVNLKKAAKWYYEATIQGNETAKQKLYSFYSKELMKFAKDGDAQAQYEVGCDYLMGGEVEKNLKTAIKWFLMAKQQGHPEATEKFYSFYSKELERLGKEGDTRAQYELGNCYMEAKEVGRDTERAADWYKMALEGGHEQAIEKFYSFYSKVLEEKAEEGDPRAQFVVGNCYYDGGIVKKDLEEAAKWYGLAVAQNFEGAADKYYSFYSKVLEKAAKAGGDARAQYEVGNCYYDGNGVKQNKETAAEWYRLATTLGHEAAKTKFFSYYSKVLEKAAKSGDVWAQYAVGNFYYEGNGVEMDKETAAEWYLSAKNLGHGDATKKFYSFYSKVLEKAAKEDVEALYWTGCYYMDGNGVEVKQKKAIKLLLDAHDQGHPEAFDKFASVYSKDLQKMAKRGNARANLAMAKCYLAGKGVEKDVRRAQTMLQNLVGNSECGEEAAKLLESLEEE